MSWQRSARAVCLAAVIVAPVAPATAQSSRVYTNADLGKPMEWKSDVPPAVMDGLIARQFVLVPRLPQGPTALVIPYDGSRDSLPPMYFEPIGQPGFTYGAPTCWRCGWAAPSSWVLAPPPVVRTSAASLPQFVAPPPPTSPGRRTAMSRRR